MCWRACAARVHVFRVLISSMLAMVTVMLMDMANTQFYAYYMCAQHHARTVVGLVHACLSATLWCGVSGVSSMLQEMRPMGRRH